MKSYGGVISEQRIHRCSNQHVISDSRSLSTVTGCLEHDASAGMVSFHSYSANAQSTRPLRGVMLTKGQRVVCTVGNQRHEGFVVRHNVASDSVLVRVPPTSAELGDTSRINELFAEFPLHSLSILDTESISQQINPLPETLPLKKRWTHKFVSEECQASNSINTDNNRAMEASCVGVSEMRPMPVDGTEQLCRGSWEVAAESGRSGAAKQALATETKAERSHDSDADRSWLDYRLIVASRCPPQPPSARFKAAMTLYSDGTDDVDQMDLAESDIFDDQPGAYASDADCDGAEAAAPRPAGAPTVAAPAALSPHASLLFQPVAWPASCPPILFCGPLLQQPTLWPASPPPPPLPPAAAPLADSNPAPPLGPASLPTAFGWTGLSLCAARLAGIDTAQSVAAGARSDVDSPASVGGDTGPLGAGGSVAVCETSIRTQRRGVDREATMSRSWQDEAVWAVGGGEGGGSLSAARSGGREVRKCRKVYGVELRERWCTQCRWKKACTRFATPPAAAWSSPPDRVLLLPLSRPGAPACGSPALSNLHQ